MKAEKKKVVIVLLFGVALFGTLLWWLLSPILKFQAESLAQEEGVAVNPFTEDLAAAAAATENEEKYLQGVNTPTEVITDADEGSLALIKKGQYGAKKEQDSFAKDKDDDRFKKYDRTARVSSVDSARGKLRGALSKLGLGGLGGGGGRGGSGYAPGDLRKWADRFKPGSGFQGGKVATGPNAATKVGGKGTRAGSPDSQKAEQMAKGAGQKFGEQGQLARPVDPKSALSNLAGSVPTELGGKGKQDNAKADAPKEYKINKEKEEKDPCAGVKPTSVGQALGGLFANIGIGIGFVAAGAAMPEGKVGTPLGNNLTQQGIGIGMKGITDGISQLSDLDRPIKECRGQASKSSGIAGALGGLGSALGGAVSK